MLHIEEPIPLPRMERKEKVCYRTMETKVSLPAEEIASYAVADAVAFVDSVLGKGESWMPTVLGYRFTSEFQKDWKVEVGRWLLHAKNLGYLPQLESRLIRAVLDAENPIGQGPEQSTHVVLQSELADAAVTYYLTSLGWRFVEWQPKIFGGDVDVRLISPSGSLTDIQVKCVNGDRDGWVNSQLIKGFNQLVNAPGPSRLVCLFTRSTWRVDLVNLTSTVIGVSQGDGKGNVHLSESRRGLFGQLCNMGISGVAELHLARGLEEALYRFTVLLNPWCNAAATLNSAEFPHARVCHLVGENFNWTSEQPTNCGLISGTRYIENA